MTRLEQVGLDKGPVRHLKTGIRAMTAGLPEQDPLVPEPAGIPECDGFRPGRTAFSQRVTGWTPLAFIIQGALPSAASPAPKKKAFDKALRRKNR